MTAFQPPRTHGESIRASGSSSPDSGARSPAGGPFITSAGATRKGRIAAPGRRNGRTADTHTAGQLAW